MIESMKINDAYKKVYCDPYKGEFVVIIIEKENNVIAELLVNIQHVELSIASGKAKVSGVSFTQLD